MALTIRGEGEKSAGAGRALSLGDDFVFDQPFGCDPISSVSAVQVTGAHTLVRLEGSGTGANRLFVLQLLWLDGDTLRLVYDASDVAH